MEKVVFLDRDGVISKEMPRWEYVKTWDQFEFLPKAIDGIKLLKREGFKIILITNQPGIARKELTAKALDIIHKKMQQSLEKEGAKIDYIYICPHDYHECDCRKPKPGMLLQASKDHEIDLTKAWVIGDKDKDVSVGKAVGARTILIGNDKDGIAMDPDFVARDLYTAAKVIVESKRV